MIVSYSTVDNNCTLCMVYNLIIPMYTIDFCVNCLAENI